MLEKTRPLVPSAGSSCTSPWQLMRCRLYLFFCEKNDQTRSQWHFCNCGGWIKRRPMTFQTTFEVHKKTSHVSTSWNLSGTYRYERFLTKIFFELKITKMWVKAKYVTKNNRLYTMSEADHKNNEWKILWTHSLKLSSSSD